jgi:hypothetical protein
MLLVTRPALRPLTAATAALVAGAVGVAPATAAGAPSAAAAAAHRRAPHPQPAGEPVADATRGPASGGEGAEASPSAPAIGTPVPPEAMPAAVGATTARGPGAPQTGLAVGSVVVAGDGIDGAPPGGHGTAESASGAPARARGPPR